MRDSSQYKKVAEWLHNKSSLFYNSFKWVQDLKPNQKAIHKVSQQINVDCHNGYLSGIFQKMAQSEPFRLQHKSYNKVIYDVERDRDNRKEDIPDNIILRRLTSCVLDEENHRPIGRKANELRGTLFLSNNNRHLHSICKDSLRGYGFSHPWFWTVPTVEQILKVFEFCEQKYLDKLEQDFAKEKAA